MKLEVSRNVVRDLWPLYRAGEASSDSRAIVESYLASDPSFAATMKEGDKLVAAEKIAAEDLEDGGEE